MNNNNKISSLQFSILIIYPILSLFSGIGLYSLFKSSSINSYISVAISFVLGFFILLMFLYIFDYNKTMTLPQKNIDLFGSVLGNIINYIINLLLILAGIIVVYSISNFIVSQFLAETPIYIILLLMGVVSIYSASKGIEVLSRVGLIFFIIVIVLTFISTFGLISHFDISNLKPILENGISSTIPGAVSLTLTNIIPIVIALIIPKSDIADDKNVNKYLIVAYSIGMLFIFLATILTTAALGAYLIKIYPHPEYMVLKKITLLGFIDKIENIVYVKWLLNNFISLCLVVYYIARSITTKDKQIAVPAIVVIIIIVLSQILFSNNTQFKWFVYNVYPYCNLILLIIFVIISINIFIRNIIKKRLS